MSTYDVIIIGGRPAGSTLAARLGKYGYSVLLLERATFPSLPAASSPIIYAPTMQLLDEIGAREDEYAHNTPQLRSLHFGTLNGFSEGFPIPDDGRRDYGYAVDRARFDHALWNTAARYPTVTVIQGFSVTDLLWEGDRVAGVTGHGDDKVRHEFYADLVVGADGRFSLVARKVNAEVRDDNTRYPTSLLYAYWRNAHPHTNGEPCSVAYEGQTGVGYLMMDSADNTAAVVVEGRAELFDSPAGQSEAFYLDLLRQQPMLWARLQEAEMVTSVRGMRRIGNLYRQPGGAGWALVGDAYHQKDPLDGQGIFSAVFSAKSLAWAIRYWKNGEKSWDEALEWYDETVRIKTYPMFKSLLNRVQQSFYPNAQPPEWLQEMMSRWIFSDPQVGKLLGRYVTQQIPPDVMTLMTPPLMVQAMVRGSLRELRERVESRLPFARR